MKARCLDPRDKNFSRYGGRGIKVCQRWLDSYDDFFKDVGARPTTTHQLDRINNDGNYEPGNVRWATPQVQSSNKRTNVRPDHDGKSLTIAEWSRLTGLKQGLIHQRVFRDEWDVARALTTPPSLTKRTVTFKGETLSLKAWSEKLGIGLKVLSSRLSKGWEIERAFTTPQEKVRKSSCLGN
jgi:hypothetical protein